MKRPRAVGTWLDAALGALLRPVRKAFGARLGAMRRDRRTVVEEVDGLPILVLPDVFNPVLFHTGTVLARAARQTLTDRPRSADRARVLDVGTGSGVAAVFAAMRGGRVDAVDVNPQAVRCARLNAQLHHLEDVIDVREGDLFEPVAGAVYDLVLFNPPFYKGRADTFLEAAHRSDDLIQRFADGLPAVLAPGGQALVVLSTEGDCDDLVYRLRAAGLVLEEHSRTRWFGQLLVVQSARKG